ncbi:hypothetical protein [Massilia antarctica]|uniref:hypothetical protein n=1 Tax=Massilia antarctica TaxID=2765360 RepID=UPI001E64A191|nr:hypothetical protein [Massilia antarctica]
MILMGKPGRTVHQLAQGLCGQQALAILRIDPLLGGKLGQPWKGGGHGTQPGLRYVAIGVQSEFSKKRDRFIVELHGLAMLAPLAGKMCAVAQSATEINQIPAIARFLMSQGLALPDGLIEGRDRLVPRATVHIQQSQLILAGGKLACREALVLITIGDAVQKIDGLAIRHFNLGHPPYLAKRRAQIDISRALDFLTAGSAPWASRLARNCASSLLRASTPCTSPDARAGSMASESAWSRRI